ncbi:hypothetical protein [Vulcanisaeta souniana]|uniref:hypothetical protein n=1 Tax=Vulcanisaeta souniana TaxID=164452 RepID=UPI001FB3DAFF|nr:hypothetical protein [Vulcanisaeta souniana]
MGMYGGMGPQMMLFMRWLPPANYNTGYAYGYEYTFTITALGTYWYLCTYPGGHAEEGMYGEIIAVGNGLSTSAYPYPTAQYPGTYYGPGWMGGMMGGGGNALPMYVGGLVELGGFWPMVRLWVVWMDSRRPNRRVISNTHSTRNSLDNQEFIADIIKRWPSTWKS